MKYKTPPPSLQEKKTVMDATRSGLVSSVDYTRPVSKPIGADLGLLGAQPSLISGDHIGQAGQAADNIWTAQYSAGGSIYDALIDAPSMPAPTPKVEKAFAPNPIDPAKLQMARAMRTDDTEEPGFFEQNQAFAGFILGVVAMLMIKKYL